jgi:CheY-like chemotaxis protein
MSHAGPRTVLVVEDDVDVRESLVEVLADRGYILLAAANGKEALEMLRGGGTKPGLILLDIMMPVMDGQQFRAAQLEDPELAAIPVIVLSAHAKVADLMRQMGVCGFLRKPVELKHLLAAVDESLRKEATA